MKDLEVKIKINSKVPTYESEEAAGCDLRACIENQMFVEPNRYIVVPTGIFLEIPKGYEAQIRPRSGLAVKYGVTTLNSPGTIDSDYRGEIKVILINHGTKPFTINDGDRIAQMVFASVDRAVFTFVDDLSDTKRSDKGFGSTGV